MPCSCVGMLSVAASAAAVVLSAFAAGLPLWSLLAYSNNGQMTSATFTAGVWGYCTDVSFLQSGSHGLDENVQTTGQCYLYYSSSRNVRVDLNASDANSTIVLPNQGACATFAQDGGSKKRLLSTVLDIDEATFDAFLTNTCSAKGKASLAFAMLSPIFGAFAFCLLLAGVCCARNESCIVGFAAMMTGLATIWAAIAFIVWNGQAPSGQRLRLGASYYMEVAATVSYATSCFFAAVHMQQGKKSERKSNAKATSNLQATLDKQRSKVASGRMPTRLV
ncbi:hypothetical protein SDRG_09849 [Saprolegnia diclina VS20]|uniref:Uncharacterized protein n=1 Tax=Saprolegnia diclina (strain VS20) TaxID=1156394 RepID=T0RJW0_SAPDV|nr:hypothetical protein SDRG_09849 [Saprolegnia diclina VS20]EQC32523.1 hypothetical protein SDRG_09849 [Saprolegnia diclina VS20]|eukprot:XP_008614024.1 hypothetical protein SDRG_09849 [Saprolegnia diclina VS20]